MKCSSTNSIKSSYCSHINTNSRIRFKRKPLLHQLITVFLLFFLSNHLTAQSGEIGLSYQYGIAGNRLRKEYDSQFKFADGKNGDLNSSQWLNDHVISFNYKHQFIKRWKLMWNLGIERGSFNRFNNISMGGLIFDVVSYRTIRKEFQIGLTKRFELKNSAISFDIGVDLSYRDYKFSQGTSSADEYEVSYAYNTVEFKYQYFYKDKNFGYSNVPKVLNPEIHFNAHFPLMKNLFLDAGARVAFNYYEFQYTNYIIRQYDASGTVYNMYSIQSAGAPNFRKGNYIYLNLGLSYRFDWSTIKWFKPKEGK